MLFVFSFRLILNISRDFCKMLHDQTGAESLRKKLQSSAFKVLDILREYGFHFHGARCFLNCKHVAFVGLFRQVPGTPIRYLSPMLRAIQHLQAVGFYSFPFPIGCFLKTGSPLCYSGFCRFCKVCDHLGERLQNSAGWLEILPGQYNTSINTYISQNTST